MSSSLSLHSQQPAGGFPTGPVGLDVRVHKDRLIETVSACLINEPKVFSVSTSTRNALTGVSPSPSSQSQHQQQQQQKSTDKHTGAAQFMIPGKSGARVSLVGPDVFPSVDAVEVEVDAILQDMPSPVDRIVALTHAIASEDGEFVLKVALYLRQDLGIRTTANFLVALCGYEPQCLFLLEVYVEKIVQLPSDWLQIASFAHDMPFRESRGIPSALRKALAASFLKFSEFSLAKYNNERTVKRRRYRANAKEKREAAKRMSEPNEGSDNSQHSDSGGFPMNLHKTSEERQTKKPTTFTLKEMVRILHISKPVYTVMCILGKRYPTTEGEFIRLGLNEEISDSASSAKVDDKESDPKTDGNDDAPASSTKKRRAFDASMAGKRMRLLVPTTWERELSKHGNTPGIWELLVKDRKLPFMAMLRNLRNMILQCVNEETHSSVMGRLGSESQIASSRQFPYRFYSALQAVQVDSSNIRLLLSPEPPKGGRGGGRGRGRAVRNTQRDLSKLSWKRKAELRKRLAKRAALIAPLGRRWANVPGGMNLYLQNLQARYRAALSRAMTLATKLNVVPIKGRSVVVIILSHEMLQPVSAVGASGENTSTTTYLDLAAVLAAMLKYACEDCSIVLASDTRFEELTLDDTASGGTSMTAEEEEAMVQAGIGAEGTVQELSQPQHERKDILSVIEKIVSRCFDFIRDQQGDSLTFPYSYVDNLIQKRIPIESFVVLDTAHFTYSSHNRDAPSLGDLPVYLSRLRRLCNEEMLYVAVNIFGLRTFRSDHESPAVVSKAFSHHNDVLLTGFSDSILRLVAERANGGPRRYIEHIDEKYGVARPKKKDEHATRSLKLLVEAARVSRNAATSTSDAIPGSIGYSSSATSLTDKGSSSVDLYSSSQGLTTAGMSDTASVQSISANSSFAGVPRRRKHKRKYDAAKRGARGSTEDVLRSPVTAQGGSVPTANRATPKVKFTTVEKNMLPIGRIKLYREDGEDALGTPEAGALETYGGEFDARLQSGKSSYGAERSVAADHEHRLTHLQHISSPSSSSVDKTQSLFDAPSSIDMEDIRARTTQSDASGRAPYNYDDDLVDDNAPEAGRPAPYNRPVISTYHTCRFFISSTFLDMNNERNTLVFDVFPRIRRWVQQKGIKANIIEVDLRWGITEGASADNLSLSVCLNEVSRCSPFFIGILGSRYGSCPTLPLNIVPDEDVSEGMFGWLWDLPDPEVEAPAESNNVTRAVQNGTTGQTSGKKADGLDSLHQLQGIPGLAEDGAMGAWLDRFVPGEQVRSSQGNRNAAAASRNPWCATIERSEEGRRPKSGGEKLPVGGSNARAAMRLPTAVEGRAGKISVTELEMRHALYNAPRSSTGKVQGTVFFARDQDSLIASLPPSKKVTYGPEKPSAPASVAALRSFIEAQNAVVVPYVAHYTDGSSAAAAAAGATGVGAGAGATVSEVVSAVAGGLPGVPGTSDPSAALRIPLVMEDFSEKAFAEIKSIIVDLCGDGDADDSNEENDDELLLHDALRQAELNDAAVVAAEAGAETQNPFSEKQHREPEDAQEFKAQVKKTDYATEVYLHHYHSQMNFAAEKMKTYVAPKGLVEVATLFALNGAEEALDAGLNSSVPCGSQLEDTGDFLREYGPDGDGYGAGKRSKSGLRVSKVGGTDKKKGYSNVLLIESKEGNGKSSAAAAVYYELHKYHGHIVPIFFSAQASALSGNVHGAAFFLSRSLSLMLQRETAPYTERTTTESLLTELSSVYAEARRKNNLAVVILDGFDKTQFSSHLQNALGWLIEPAATDATSNLRFIFTSTPESGFSRALRSRHPPALPIGIPPLSMGERARLTRVHLASYGKRLQESLGRTNELRPLLRKKEAGDAVYLLVAITYLRLFSTYDTLRNDISKIPETTDLAYLETLTQLERRFSVSTCQSLFLTLYLNAEIGGVMEHTLLRLVHDVAGTSRLVALLHNTLLSCDGGRVTMSNSSFSSCVARKYLAQSSNSVKGYEALLVAFLFSRALTLSPSTGVGSVWASSSGSASGDVRFTRALTTGAGGDAPLPSNDDDTNKNPRLLIRQALAMLRTIHDRTRGVRESSFLASLQTPLSNLSIMEDGDVLLSLIAPSDSQGFVSEDFLVWKKLATTSMFDMEKRGPALTATPSSSDKGTLHSRATRADSFFQLDSYTSHGLFALLFYAARARQHELYVHLAFHIPLLERLVEDAELLDHFLVLSREVLDSGHPQVRPLNVLLDFAQAQAHILRKRPDMIRQLILNTPRMSEIVYGGSRDASAMDFTSMPCLSSASEPPSWVRWVNPMHRGGNRCTSTSFPSSEPLLGATYNPSGGDIVSFGVDQRVRAMTRNNVKSIHSTLNHPDAVLSIEFLSSSGGDVIITGCADGVVRVWSLEDNSLQQEGRFHTRGVSSLGCHPASSLVCSGGMDGNCAMWMALSDPGASKSASARANGPKSSNSEMPQKGGRDRNALHPQRTLHHHTGPVSCCQFHLEGRFLATGSWDGSVHFFDLEYTNTKYRAQRNTKRAEGNDALAIQKGDAPSEQLVGIRNSNATKGDESHLVFYTGSTVRSLSFVPSLVVMCAVALYNGDVCVYDHAAGACAARFTLHSGVPITSLSFSPDSKLMLTADELGTLRLTYSGVRGTPLCTLSGHHHTVTSAVFHPQDAKRVLSASRDASVRQWHVEQSEEGNTEERAVGALHSTAVTACAVASNGKFFVTGSADGEALFFSASDASAAVAQVNVTSSVFATSSKPRQPGSAFDYLSGDAEVSLSTLLPPPPPPAVAFEPLFVMRHDNQRITCLVVTPENNAIVSGTAFGWLYVWATTAGIDPKSGKLLRKLCLTHHLSYPVVNIEFSTASMDIHALQSNFSALRRRSASTKRRGWLGESWIHEESSASQRSTMEGPGGEHLSRLHTDDTESMRSADEEKATRQASVSLATAASSVSKARAPIDSSAQKVGKDGVVFATCSNGSYALWTSQAALLSEKPVKGMLSWALKPTGGAGECERFLTDAHGSSRLRMAAILGEELLGCIPLPSLEKQARMYCGQHSSSSSSDSAWPSKAFELNLVLLVGVHRCVVASMRHGVVLVSSSAGLPDSNASSIAAGSDSDNMDSDNQHDAVKHKDTVLFNALSKRNVELSSCVGVHSVHLGSKEYFTAFSTITAPFDVPGGKAALEVGSASGSAKHANTATHGATHTESTAGTKVGSSASVRQAGLSRFSNEITSGEPEVSAYQSMPWMTGAHLARDGTEDVGSAGESLQAVLLHERYRRDWERLSRATGSVPTVPMMSSTLLGGPRGGANELKDSQHGHGKGGKQPKFAPPLDSKAAQLVALGTNRGSILLYEVHLRCDSTCCGESPDAQEGEDCEGSIACMIRSFLSGVQLLLLNEIHVGDRSGPAATSTSTRVTSLALQRTLVPDTQALRRALEHDVVESRRPESTSSTASPLWGVRSQKRAENGEERSTAEGEPSMTVPHCYESVLEQLNSSPPAFLFVGCGDSTARVFKLRRRPIGSPEESAGSSPMRRLKCQWEESAATGLSGNGGLRRHDTIAAEEVGLFYTSAPVTQVGVIGNASAHYESQPSAGAASTRASEPTVLPKPSALSNCEGWTQMLQLSSTLAANKAGATTTTTGAATWGPQTPLALTSSSPPSNEKLTCVLSSMWIAGDSLGNNYQLSLRNKTELT